MFNQYLKSDPDDHRCQEDDAFDESDEDPVDTPHGNLDSEVHRIAANLKRAAFNSCISDIEVEDDYNLVKNVLEQLQCFVRKPWIKEAVIISAILLLKTGLFVVYRLARKEGLEIVNL